MAWLWRLSLKKRILIAVVVLPVIHAAFYAVPRLVTTRPRFDEKAWQQATDLLKEEVGEAAVESDAFSIPKVPISTPHRGRAYIPGEQHSGRHYNMHILMERGSSCLLFHSRHAAENVRKLKVAQISDDQAAEIWGVLTYLQAMEGVTLYRRNAVYYANRITLVDSTWPMAGVVGADDLSFPLWHYWRDVIAGSCARRFVRSLGEKSDLTWSSEPAAVANALIRLLNASTPPACEADSTVAAACVGWLQRMPSPDALPAFRRIANLQAARSNAASSPPPDIAFLPIIGKYFERGKGKKYPLPHVDAVIWFAEAIAGEPPERQLEIAWAAFLDPQTLHDKLQTVLLFLRCRWPGELADLMCADYAKMDEDRVQICMENYEEFFGDDVRVARLAVRDVSVDVQLSAHYYLYRLTGDQTHFARLMELATPRDDPDAGPVYYAADYLADIWREGSCPVDILQFFREHLCEDNVRVLIPLLAETGGRENLDFLLSLMVSGESDAAGWNDPNSLMYIRVRAAAALAESNDAHIIDALIEYLGTGPPKGDEEVRDMLIIGLARAGNPKALATLEAFLAMVQQDWSALPMRTSSRGRELSRWQHAPLAVLAPAVTELRLRCDEHPVEFKFPSGINTRRNRGMFEAHSEALAAKYTLEELLAFLADKKYAARRGEIYAAIILKRREGEGH